MTDYNNEFWSKDKEQPNAIQPAEETADTGKKSRENIVSPNLFSFEPFNFVCIKQNCGSCIFNFKITIIVSER